jgi:hypothetical protein
MPCSESLGSLICNGRKGSGEPMSPPIWDQSPLSVAPGDNLAKKWQEESFLHILLSPLLFLLPIIIWLPGSQEIYITLFPIPNLEGDSLLYLKKKKTYKFTAEKSLHW